MALQIESAGDRSHGMASDQFEPPKYVCALISSINDSAKAAQTTALFFSFLGLYLAATAISITDEDILRGSTTELSQLGGVKIPVAVSFIVGPIVFLLIHCHMLLRYYMLASNLRLFCDELDWTVESTIDRNRCRQLLANVEFVFAIIGRGSHGDAPIYRLVAILTIAIIPVVVLLAVQISFIRYQSESITWTHRVVIILDMAFLIVFAIRIAQISPLSAYTSPFVFLVAYLLSTSLFISNIAYMGVPAIDAPTVRYDVLLDRGVNDISLYHGVNGLINQPLDLFICPSLGWGCRYLRLDHRTLIGKVWKDEGVVRLRDRSDVRGSLAAIEGLFLRGRSLRFASFDQSWLYAVDLIGADLAQATFRNAALQGANLARASLPLVDLQGAHLEDANLQGANLSRANLESGFLASARLQGANLENAHLQGADMPDVQLQGSNLKWAWLRDANLRNANLQGANLTLADLENANLEFAQLQGASLNNVQLFGANLREAQLTAVDMRRAHICLTTLGSVKSIDLADMREIDLLPMSDKACLAIKTAQQTAIPITAVENIVLADTNQSYLPIFTNLHVEGTVINSVPLYEAPLAPFLAALAVSDPATAAGIAQRMSK